MTLGFIKLTKSRQLAVARGDVAMVAAPPVSARSVMASMVLGVEHRQFVELVERRR
jgi:hypothetical protein